MEAAGTRAPATDEGAVAATDAARRPGTPFVTVTPNPSLDLTLEIGRLERGEVQRASATAVEAGGKGVNVARASLAHGHAVHAVLPIGGPEGEQHLAFLAPLDLEIHPVPIANAIRTNVRIVEPDGTVTKINAAGSTITPEEVESPVKTALACLDGVVVSLGERGAVLVDASISSHARPPKVTSRSSVGAGHALLAGFLSAGGRSPAAPPWESRGVRPPRAFRGHRCLRQKTWSSNRCW